MRPGHLSRDNHQVGLLISQREEVAKESGIPVQFQRFWLWAKRQNHTYRPNRPLTHQEEAQSVSTFCCYLLSMYDILLFCSLSYYEAETNMTYNLGGGGG
uniref:Ubiquitin carboxyl-terminal hydrolase 7 ICP0-binding domain-containing protein n=1 Tax=Nelumbo nucifera TaxID=4432 RepID=A0A822YXH7_NELNU|nr:TPA_asm: hypothetical protein HUJ06_007851 [Nelumbo nucifera]